MKAFALPAFDAAPALQELPAPTPGAGELLVRVRASSVNPADLAIVGGMLQGMFEHEFPIVLGRDYAGVVEEAGPGVTLHAPATTSSGSSCTPTRPSTTGAGRS